MKIKKLVTLRYYLYYSYQSKVFHQNNQVLLKLTQSFRNDIHVKTKTSDGGKKSAFLWINILWSATRVCTGVTCCFLCIWKKSINYLHFYMPKCISVMLRLKQWLVLKSSLNTDFEIINQDLTDRIHCNEKNVKALYGQSPIYRAPHLSVNLFSRCSRYVTLD